jgi:hypothetical protein
MKRHSKSTILFNKIDTRLSKTFYGNKTGFMKNIRGRSKVLTSIDESVKKSDPQLYDAIYRGFTKFNNSYNESLINEIKQKFQNLIEDENHSKSIAEFDNKTYLRMINEPYKLFPELSKLITNDVLSFLKKYYKSNFTISWIQCHRNYFVPENVRKEHEMFSNFWHFDLEPLSQIKYFVYLSDVTEKDGPFTVQSIDRTKELLDMGFGDRFDYKLPLDIIEDPNQVVKVTGKAGTSFFGRPTSCLHRAGDPEENHYRDAITFTINASDEPIQENWIDNVVPLYYQNPDFKTSK